MSELIFTEHNQLRERAVAFFQKIQDDITSTLSATLPVPVIASGGAGTMEHFYDVFEQSKADAALAASIFHFHEIGIPELKSYLSEKGVSIRL